MQQSNPNIALVDQPSVATRNGVTDISASEAACYAFCAKAWELEHLRAQRPTAETVARRIEGTAAHDAQWRMTLRSWRRDEWLLAGGILLLAAATYLVAAGLRIAGR